MLFIWFSLKPSLPFGFLITIISFLITPSGVTQSRKYYLCIEEFKERIKRVNNSVLKHGTFPFGKSNEFVYKFLIQNRYTGKVALKLSSFVDSNYLLIYVNVQVWVIR